VGIDVKVFIFGVDLSFVLEIDSTFRVEAHVDSFFDPALSPFRVAKYAEVVEDGKFHGFSCGLEICAHFQHPIRLCMSVMSPDSDDS
jgi:hypothetical protein